MTALSVDDIHVRLQISQSELRTSPQIMLGQIFDLQEDQLTQFIKFLLFYYLPPDGTTIFFHGTFLSRYKAEWSIWRF
jgi:hypothetical protein